MNDSYYPYIDKERCLSWRVESAPCQAACPLGMDVEGYVTAIAGGQFARALQIIREKCPLPSVCGRVCHHPCEAECKRSQVDAPLAIRGLKRFAADQGSDSPERPEPLERTKEEKIAVIGSGPAGLTAAYDLVHRGYGVTVFEALPVPGGLLAFGIPEFDLPQEVVQAEIEHIKALGVEIKTQTPVGESLTVEELSKMGYRAILVAVGALGSASLPIPGNDLEGVLYALPFLREAKMGQVPSLKGKGLVIGGGNVAVDAARTALRLGAAEVHLACIESRENMPAFSWMVGFAEKEGVQIHPARAPQAMKSKDGKRVSQVEMKKVAHSERTPEGGVTWTLAEGPDADVSMDADFVIIAIGQKVEFLPRGEFEKLSRKKKGTLSVEPGSLATNLPGVFAAGDIVAMPSTVVESMAAGRRAATAIDLYLQKKELPKEPSATNQVFTGKEILPLNMVPEKRQEMSTLPAAESIRSFQEVELGFSKEQAMEEARRCLQCKTCNHCIAETICVAFFAADHDGKQSPTVRGKICAGCGRCARACPYENILLTPLG
jgi:NADPH-dependent glutamate synthase beta subunit-like oxidoreductase